MQGHPHHRGKEVRGTNLHLFFLHKHQDWPHDFHSAKCVKFITLRQSIVQPVVYQQKITHLNKIQISNLKLPLGFACTAVALVTAVS